MISVIFLIELFKGLYAESAYLLISNLPTGLNVPILKNRLNFLCNNCGGRVVEVLPDQGVAFIRFTTQDFANRLVENKTP